MSAPSAYEGARQEVAPQGSAGSAATRCVSMPARSSGMRTWSGLGLWVRVGVRVRVRVRVMG